LSRTICPLYSLSEFTLLVVYPLAYCKGGVATHTQSTQRREQSVLLHQRIQGRTQDRPHRLTHTTASGRCWIANPGRSHEAPVMRWLAAKGYVLHTTCSSVVGGLRYPGFLRLCTQTIFLDSLLSWWLPLSPQPLFSGRFGVFQQPNLLSVLPEGGPRLSFRLAAPLPCPLVRGWQFRCRSTSGSTPAAPQQSNSDQELRCQRTIPFRNTLSIKHRNPVVKGLGGHTGI
jgi:hypothetical protein